MKLVLVEWLDAYGGGNEGWHSLETALKTKPSYGRTAGYMLHEGIEHGIEYILVSPHLMLDTEGALVVDSELAIPKVWIKEIKVLGSVSI